MPSSNKPVVPPEVRWRMVAEAAWYRFQARNYVHGHHEQDWIDAEKEVDAQLRDIDFHPLRADGSDNLEIIEGIGPKIAELLAQAGITTFAGLAKARIETLRAVLAKAGPRFAMAVPTTWPEQAALAASGQWVALAKLMKELDAGVRR